jgi:hypothetical protein
MPFKIEAEQKHFAFALSPDGLPVGTVEKWGGIPYLLCCPLCGMLHQIIGGSALTIGEYEPRCIIRQTHKTVYVDWVSKYPQAAQYTRVSLRQRAQDAPNVIPLETPARTVKRTRRKAA